MVSPPDCPYPAQTHLLLPLGSSISISISIDISIDIDISISIDIDISIGNSIIIISSIIITFSFISIIRKRVYNILPGDPVAVYY